MKKIMLNISLLVSLVAINNTNTAFFWQTPDYQQRVNSYNQQRQANYQQSYNQRENNLSGWAAPGVRESLGNLMDNQMAIASNYNNRDTDPYMNSQVANWY